MKYLSLKKSITLLSIGLLTGVMAILSGCVKQKFDVPPIIVPHYAGTANRTIDTLVKMYGTHPDTLLITQDIVIKGVIAGNDESGNIYKKFFLQDNTGGIDVEIDQTSLYTSYKVGQKVFIELKGLYLGTYGGTLANGGALEIGYPFNGTIGRIPAALVKLHIFADSLPGKAPDPVMLDLTSSSFDKYINMLVAIPEVRFPDAGKTFVTGGVTTPRPIGDAFGNPLTLGGKSWILYTSSYADFATSPLPAGIGTVQGIFTVFGSKYEVLVRNIKDMVSFMDTGQTVIYQNNFDAAPSDWVIFTKAGNGWAYDASYTEMTGNGYGGTAPSDTWLISPALDLSAVTNPVLTFNSWTKYTDAGLANPMDVVISTNYSGSGDPTTSTWTSLQCTLPAANSGAWTSSGDVALTAFHQVVYVAFHYRSSGVSSSTAAKWEVDTFKLTGRK
jgi:hypothetical protein